LTHVWLTHGTGLLVSQVPFAEQVCTELVPLQTVLPDWHIPVHWAIPIATDTQEALEPQG
jgi:hypothetical protein